MKQLIGIAFLLIGTSAFALTPEAKDLKLRREMTGLGFAPDVTVVSILDYVISKRGTEGPITRDDKKTQQLVLVDKEGVKWTSETDGGVVEIRDERGRTPLVFETKTDWFKEHETDRMLLSLESLIAVGVVPHYRYGGGHIKIRLVPHFEEHPLQFASLMNLFLKYEPILVHLMMHQRRTDHARPYFSTRMSTDQLSAAGLPGNSNVTLAQFLGNGLNDILTGTLADCRQNEAIKRRYEKEQKPGLSLKENCVLAFLAYFATDIVDKRESGINLQSWRGASNPMRLKKALELRFFNAPVNAEEASLEEAMVRAMADQAIRSGQEPILYEERMAPFYDLDSFYISYSADQREGDFGELLRSSGFNEASVKRYFKEYLDNTKWSKRRQN